MKDTKKICEVCYCNSREERKAENKFFVKIGIGHWGWTTWLCDKHRHFYSDMPLRIICKLYTSWCKALSKPTSTPSI